MPDENQSSAGKMEGRWLAFLTAIALAFGGIWLQNQYDTTLRLQEQLNDLMKHIDDGYVRKDYFSRVEDRLDRIETKIDNIADPLKRIHP
jgi:hypothetical protein